MAKQTKPLNLPGDLRGQRESDVRAQTNTRKTALILLPGWDKSMVNTNLRN